MRLDDGTELTFRLARRGADDGAKFCALYNSLYERKIGHEYYDWQFFQPPFPTVLSLAVNEADGSLAGCLGYQLRPSLPGGGPIGWAIDVMLAPEYQRRGVFREFAAWAESRALQLEPAALAVMANARSAPIFQHGLGWTKVNTLRSQVCPTAMSEGALISSDLSFAPLSGFDRFAPDTWRPGGDLTLTARSPDFLNWRFEKHPNYSYNGFAVSVDERPSAYLVLKTFRDPVSGEVFGDVADILWDAHARPFLKDILWFALDYHRSEGVEKSLMWLQTNTALDAAGRAVGFRPISQERYFLCKPLKEGLERLEDPKRWFATLCDSEIY